MADGRAHDRKERLPSSDGEEELVLGELERGATLPDGSSAPMVRGGLSRRGWAILIAVAGAAVIVLLILSELAIKNPTGFAHAAITSASPTASAQGPAVDPRPTDDPTPSPTASAVPSVPTQPVSTLKTGDCLQIYPSPWENGYPVVDCAAPHIAQVLTIGTLPQPSNAPFPGTKALNDQVNDLCSAPNLLDWNWVAIWNEDVYVDPRYPNTNALWASGARSYYCFVYTFSRHELTGSALPPS
jgi:Septum formation